MFEKIHYVYLTTNLINGKQYIGDHTINLNQKLYYPGSGVQLKNDVKKYKSFNFFKEILEWFSTRREAFNAQEKYVKLYKTHISQGGYNMNWTGETYHGGAHSKETKLKMRNVKLGKKATKETREKMSEIHKGINIWSKGKTHTEKTKLKISENQIGRKISEKTKVKISEKQKGIKKIFYFLKKYGEIEGIKKYNESIKQFKEKITGRSTSRKGKGHKKELIEIYGENEGLRRYEDFVKKQREAKIGKVTWNTGLKRSLETRKKISESHKGIKQSAETIEKRRQKQIGRKRSDETKLKMSLAALGKPKKYDNWNKGKTTIEISLNTIKDIKDMAKNKITQREIAKKYNFSISRIARIIKNNKE